MNLGQLQRPARDTLRGAFFLNLARSVEDDE